MTKVGDGVISLCNNSISVLHGAFNLHSSVVVDMCGVCGAGFFLFFSRGEIAGPVCGTGGAFLETFCLLVLVLVPAGAPVLCDGDNYAPIAAPF